MSRAHRTKRCAFPYCCHRPTVAVGWRIKRGSLTPVKTPHHTHTPTRAPKTPAVHASLRLYQSVMSTIVQLLSVQLLSNSRREMFQVPG